MYVCRSVKKFYVIYWTAQGLEFNADSKLNYQALWKTSISASTLFTNVKACKSAYITLAESPGVTMYNTYDIQLGVSDNTESIIYKHADSGIEYKVIGLFGNFGLFSIALIEGLILVGCNKGQIFGLFTLSFSLLVCAVICLVISSGLKNKIISHRNQHPTCSVVTKWYCSGWGGMEVW